MTTQRIPPYEPDPQYATRVAYFSMEFAIEQPLKIYSGGLGYLAGSHLRSAAQLQQNLIGIGILWKYGYYDQTRRPNQHMEASFLEKHYSFLEPTNITFQITVHQAPVLVTAYYLDPKHFGTAPLFLLSTDLPENDYLAQTISHYLYDVSLEAKVAQSILLGEGGVKLLDALQLTPEVYHLNESHALPVAFALYEKYQNWKEVRSRLVFTNHTPEEAGNQKTDMQLLANMSFFGNIPVDEIRQATQQRGPVLNHTLACLRLAGIANGVSNIHTDVLRHMYQDQPGLCPIVPITNAQDYTYWADKTLYELLRQPNGTRLRQRKQAMKKALFDEVADQTGKLFSPNVLTIVWARRFVGYKRADLLLHDLERFQKLINNVDYPVQLIWAGKPYPHDSFSIDLFNQLVDTCLALPNCAVLTGYELRLSKLLKQGADVWLNNPKIKREASGTSGMTAAMNGAINVSIPDGWVPEFARDGLNCFVVPAADYSLPDEEKNAADANHLYQVLENQVIPIFYDEPERWESLMQHSLTDILPTFDSKRMAADYYQKMYKPQTVEAATF